MSSVADGLGAHPGDERVAVLLLGLAVFLLAEELVLGQRGVARDR